MCEVINVKKPIQEIFEEAINKKASDISFLPKDGQYEIKFNIYGKIELYQTCSEDFGRQLLNYLKFKADMTISEQRRPQLGSWVYRNDRQKIFCRISTVGNFLRKESMVVRLIYSNRIIDDAYFYPEQFYQIQQACNKSGMIVFSGPMGSGKTTTMYNVARRLKGKQIMTIEDPVEIYEPNFLQIQVNEKAQMSYPELLKVALRHHPDIFVIGEIRDEKTAKVAINAALSGHLILTTVHARNVYGVYQRLKNLGITDGELKQTLQLVSYQRMMSTTDGKAKILFDQIDGDTLDYAIENQTNLKMTNNWRNRLEECYLNGEISTEIFEKFKEG